MSILAIDGDSIVYKACFIAQKTVYDVVPKSVDPTLTYDEYKPKLIQTFRLVKEYETWLKENNKTKDDFNRIPRTELQPVAYALQIVGQMLRDIIDAVGCEQTVLYIGGVNNFREDLAVIKGYKETRKKKDKPLYYETARDYMVTHWNAIKVDGEEADDAVAQMYTSCELDDQICIIATIDKDLNTVPGWKYNYDKKQFFFVDEREASYNFYVQLIMGDKNDDIVGVPGIGEKGAKKLLADCTSEWEMYQTALNEYNKAFKVEKTTHLTKKYAAKVGEKMLRENAQLLHMRRFRGEIWTPPTQS